MQSPTGDLEVIEGRFEIEAVAGTGGMGTVYRARDRVSGERVALKMLRGNASAENAERFAREIRVLANLRHPGIVRYVADGRTTEGPEERLWLAMEWLDGENLSQRLSRAGLSPAEAVHLLRRVAEALGAAHDRGVVHRDIKPSNLFLVGRDLERVVVLDFGVARIADAVRGVTGTGVMVGTPGYMAPEQVRGDRDVGPRADVFAAGCVLFECLTGRPAFVGEHMMAVLAKIILEEAPRASELRDDLPPALDELVARAMSKMAMDRPRDGAHLASELAAIGRIDAHARPPAMHEAESLTATERRLLSVVLIGEDHDEIATVGGAASARGAAPARSTIAGIGAVGGPVPPPAFANPATITNEVPIAALPALAEAARVHGATLDRLANGSYVVTMLGKGATRDQVTQAARCALAMKHHVPGLPMALATGRGVLAGRWPVGEVIDRAVGLLQASPEHVRVDEVTAGLLDAGFEVGGDAAGLYLKVERDVIEVSRTLLGKTTPCVGRDRELGVLLGLFEECVSEPVARAVIVTGAEGIGKSRVRDEVLRRIRERQGDPVEIWIGRGDPLRAGAPFGMIAPALRRAAGIHDGEPIDVRRQKLRARVLRNAAGDAHRTIVFLGELMGAAFDDASAGVVAGELRAAHHDPMLMFDQVRRAFVQLLASETATQPVVIVLEDLHWGDVPTVKLIDAAMRDLPDRPWFVLAVARPEVHETFPRLWVERNVHELRLDELTRKGGERLVRNVLGPRASEVTVARIVEQGHGNAFYLEELVRALQAADGDHVLPETVLALVQGRLERLEVDARRLLRAASVFGQAFWRGGVSALLGDTSRPEREKTGTRMWLEELIERELIARVASSRFPGEDEYQFRQSLVREAAYGMLTEGDRRLGHRLAGAWLEEVGEQESIVLAEHFERGGDLEGALEHFQRAAEQALAACDFDGAHQRAGRGVRCGAQDDTLGALRLVEAEAHRWNAEFDMAARFGNEAMAHLAPGSVRWFAAAREAAEASGKLDNSARLAEIGEALLAAAPNSLHDAVVARVSALAHAAFQLFQTGMYDLAQRLLEHIDGIADSGADVIDDPSVLARVHQARSSRAMFSGDTGAYLESEQAAAAAFERAGDLRYACVQRGHVGYACLEIGAHADAERYLTEALEGAARLGLWNVAATAKHNLGRVLMYRRRLDEALQLETDALEAFRSHNDRRLEGAARVYSAYIRAERGELARAIAELETALATAAPPMRPQILASI
ncbi:MAG: protein kinase, partial [Deltaproteobacteria bacterium]|nr:protein kinase [Deltaproteobacteria bacterium]